MPEHVEGCKVCAVYRYEYSCEFSVECYCECGKTLDAHTFGHPYGVADITSNCREYVGPVTPYVQDVI